MTLYTCLQYTATDIFKSLRSGLSESVKISNKLLACARSSCSAVQIEKK